MASSWDHLGEVANVAQLTGLDAVRLISMIVSSASAARMHKRNCRQFAQRLKLISNLLEQLKISELKKHPETREPLEQLEDALRRSYIIVNSCQDRSYMYLLAMGWNIAFQFRRAQSEIDGYLQLVPLISLVDNNRVRERLECIESNQCEYTFDEEDRKVQNAFLNLDPCESQTSVLKNTLSYSYPNVSFDIALQRENEKLQLELQRCLTDNDICQYEIIEYLLGVTEITSHALLGKPIHQESSEMEIYYLDAHAGIEYNLEGNSSPRHGTVKASSISSDVSTDNDLMSNRRSQRHEEWHSDLLACCSDPCLCIKTFFYPCGTFSRIVTVAEQRNISSAEVCNDLIAYSLILSCCCYTCCVRRKLRQMLNIKGGLFDDFLSHLMCCCCALVQERQELEIRGIHGADKTKTSPPPSQTMEY